MVYSRSSGGNIILCRSTRGGGPPSRLVAGGRGPLLTKAVGEGVGTPSGRRGGTTPLLRHKHPCLFAFLSAGQLSREHAHFPSSRVQVFSSCGCIFRSAAPEVRTAFRKKNMLQALTGCVHENTRCTYPWHSFYSILKRAHPFTEIFSVAISYAGFFQRSSHQVFFRSMRKEREYWREKYRRWNIPGFFIRLNPDFFREIFHVPSISSEHFGILQRKLTE